MRKLKNLKISFIIITLLILNINAHGQTIHSNDFKEPYEDDNYRIAIKGNIKSIKEQEYSAIDYFGELKKDTIYETILVNLNEKKFPINYFQQTLNGVDKYAELTYINLNKIQEVKCLENNIIVELYKFEYDSRGNIIEFNEYKGGTLTGKEIVIYDKNNHEIEFKKYNEKGLLTEKAYSKYDVKGRIIEEESYFDWGYHSKYNYTYNNELLTQKFYYDDDILKRKTYYKYYDSKKKKEEIEDFLSGDKRVSQFNSQGSLVKIFTLESNGVKEDIETTKYDLNNNKVFEEDSYQKLFYTYNSQGNLIKKEIHFKDVENDEIIKKIILFEYDNYGNWIKAMESNFYGNNPIENEKKIIRERIITYE